MISKVFVVLLAVMVSEADQILRNNRQLAINDHRSLSLLNIFPFDRQLKEEFRSSTPRHQAEFRITPPRSNEEFRRFSPRHQEEPQSSPTHRQEEFRSSSPHHQEETQISHHYQEEFRSSSPHHQEESQSLSARHQDEFRSSSPRHREEFRSQSNENNRESFSLLPSRSASQGEGSTTFAEVAAADEDKATGKRCVDKVEVVEQCDHSYDKRCHTTYVTSYDTQQEEECEENFR